MAYTLQSAYGVYQNEHPTVYIHHFFNNHVDVDEPEIIATSYENLITIIHVFTGR